MVRLVKGAYWDSEIKRAQVDGLADYPVYTRKPHTDIAYLACARKLLAHRELVFPQFATHNAATLTAVMELAGDRAGYEFQCLHGMGEPLYDHVIGDERFGVPCRIYAPVGTHETLLAYLVRRLLENGANTSFVHRVASAEVDLEALVADPVASARPWGGHAHPRIPLPAALYPDRVNSRGLDFASEHALSELAAELDHAAAEPVHAHPLVAGHATHPTPGRDVIAPADRTMIVGTVVEADAGLAARALDAAAASSWAALPSPARADILARAADLIEARRARFIDLAVRESGKTLPNAVGEVREAVDFLRYYAQSIRWCPPSAPLGPVVAISPWNFPLAIFTGQVAGALAAGNPVLAKPAEQSSLIAFEAVRLLHEAGVPPDALQFLPGAGETLGDALVRDPRVRAVVFTGSTEVATLIHRSLAERGNVPLVAETGGQNAMIVDASALPEQVVTDAIASAFDSAGQRCSALRVLCLQDEIADRVLAMLAGAMAELRVGDPMQLATDVGPIIDASAKRTIDDAIARLERSARLVARAPLDPSLAELGHFVAPVAFEIDSVGSLGGEIFGPVLHVLRYRATDLDALVQDLNATGYALTLGVHSRIDETIERVTGTTRAGNVYVNRNIIGAVVGVQPFGGEGRSGTGPKAGGPLYIPRLTVEPGEGVPAEIELPGPTGEQNRYRLEPRGLLVALGGADDDEAVWRAQGEAALATGNRVLFAPRDIAREAAAAVASVLRAEDPIRIVDAADEWVLWPDLAGVLAADPARAAEANRALAAREGARLPVIEPAGIAAGYPGARLRVERTITINTTATGGNASLVAMAD